MSAHTMMRRLGLLVLVILGVAAAVLVRAVGASSVGRPVAALRTGARPLPPAYKF